MKFVFILLGVAIVLEAVGPWLLQKFFPQDVMAPAPDVPVRPKRTAARNDAHVDNAMEQLSNVQQTSARSNQAGAAALVATAGAGQAMDPAVLDSNFDYEEFRPAAREELQATQVSQGIPDVFENEATSATA
jgi:hypothetical protein